MGYIDFEKTDDGIAVITIDCPGKKVNSISSGLLNEISEKMDTLENDDSIKGMVIVSAKDDNFVVGADIDELKAMTSDQEIKEYISKGHAILSRIGSLRFPVISAVHGNCLGGGLELTLVCDYRIAADSTKTVMGLPEVQIGLFPAGGGTQSLPRIFGLKQALPMMCEPRK